MNLKNTTKAVTRRVTVLFILFFLFHTSFAQKGITFTLVKQPCNNDGILAAHVSGITPPISLSWTVDGKNYIHNINSLEDTLFNYSGGYVVTKLTTPSNVYGTYPGSPPFNVRVDTTKGAVCPALGSANASVTGGTPPYTFDWYDTGGALVFSGNPAQLPAGAYYIHVTDGAGCAFGSIGGGTSGGVNQGNVFIENLSSIRFTIDTTTAQCTNGSAAVTNVTGGTPPYGYSWNTGANTPFINNLTRGYYTVTVTDALGCYRVGSAYIAQKPSITVQTTPTNATCLQNDGSAIAFGSGGMPPYAYLWKTGEKTQSISGLTAGLYTVTVTDANNCIGNAYANITSTTPITVTYTTTSSSCTSPTGSATLSISGGTAPYTTVWYTYPQQTGTTASGLMSGTYSFNVTDAAGCVRSGTVYVPPVSVVNAGVMINNAMCKQSDGSASIVVQSGMPPYSFAWSTGATTSSIANAAAGYYSCTITDNLGCSVIKSPLIKSATSINLGFSVTPSSCIFTSDGSINAIVSGGTSPYTYHWSNGQKDATATGLLQGKYYANVTDAAGCVQSGWTTVSYNAADNSCYCTIKGKVYEDQNSNCTYDNGETGIQNIMMHCSGIGYTFTDAYGNYSFKVPSGSYTISETVKSFYPLASCQNNSIVVNVTAASNCTTPVDFANVINPIHDVKISTTNFTPPVPGQNYVQKVIIANNGTVTEPNIQAGYVHDGQLTLSGFSPAQFTQQNAGSYPDWHSITSGLSLAPAGQQEFNVSYVVPTNIPLATVVNFKDTTAYTSPVSNWLNDYSPWDNVNQYQNTVLGSFDPNYIEVSPKGIDVPGYIMHSDSILNYTIHFQNTGTYKAFKVVLIDTLDSDLNIKTFQPGYSSHNCTIDMTEDGIVTYTFDDINLPDSISSPLGSIGIAMYSVHLKPGLPGNTPINNASSIYFDYNAPVKTNTVLNTVGRVSDIVPVTNENFDFLLYPNPTVGNVSVLINSSVNSDATVRFYNLLGMEVKTEVFKLEKGKKILNTDISALASGIYFVELSTGKQSIVRKLTIAK